MDDPWQRLTDYWRESGLSVPAGVDPEYIAQFEAEHHVRLPSDLRDYLLAADGAGADLDAAMFRFWPLRECAMLGLEPAEGAPAFITFADYCMDCWRYEVELPGDNGPGGAVFKQTGGSPPRERVARSLREFFEAYLVDPDSVL